MLYVSSVLATRESGILYYMMQHMPELIVMTLMDEYAQDDDDDDMPLPMEMLLLLLLLVVVRRARI